MNELPFPLEDAKEAVRRDCPTCGREMGDLNAAGTTAGRPQATSVPPGKIKRGSERAGVMVQLLAGPQTASWLAERLEKSPNQIATRLLELRQGGWVEYLYGADGKKVRRATTTGSLAYVQKLTQMGERRAVELLDPNRQGKAG